MAAGVAAVSVKTIIINKQGASMSMFVQPSGHLPEVAVVLELAATLKLDATQLQFEYDPLNNTVYELVYKN